MPDHENDHTHHHDDETARALHDATQGIRGATTAALPDGPAPIDEESPSMFIPPELERPRSRATPVAIHRTAVPQHGTERSLRTIDERIRELELLAIDLERVVGTIDGNIADSGAVRPAMHYTRRVDRFFPTLDKLLAELKRVTDRARDAASEIDERL